MSVTSVTAEAKRAIVPSDCVTVRSVLRNDSYVPSIQISPDRRHIAYLVKAPNLATNQNDIELYIMRISENVDARPTLLLTGQGISQLHWTADSRRLVMLIRVDGHGVIAEADIESGTRTVMVSVADDITEYSIDSAEDTIAFATDVAQNADIHVSAQESMNGYRIAFQSPTRFAFKRRRLFLTRRQTSGTWTTPELIEIQSPISNEKLPALQYQLNTGLSLSPNGHLLLVEYIDPSGYPKAWKTNPYVQTVLKDGFSGAPVLALYDVAAKTTTTPIKTPWAWSIPLWSADSRSFLVNSQLPIGKEWNKRLESEKDTVWNAAHLFLVQVGNGSIEEIAFHVADTNEQPLLWSPNGDVVVHISTGTIATFSRRADGWSQSRTLHIPLDDPYRYSQLATDGHHVIGDYQNATTPPEIFEFEEGEQNVTILTRLNPQFGALRIASMRRIAWRTVTGYEVHGFLFTPPDYVSSKTYPLVIQTKGDAGSFVCDSGESHDPSFAPQPIADAGMMYLIRTYPEDYSPAAERQHYPRGYPGGISEAAFQMDVWDRAVNTLAAQGLVDPDRVGIIGFSRAGWYTEFILAHSKIPYKAATVADNVQYSLGEYWLLHTEALIRGYDAMYGGSPYGKSLNDWLRYSVSFNLGKIHTPLLMEVMGKGISFDHAHEAPDNLALSFEIFTGLNKLVRPVELYFYPNEVHQPDHPRARLSSLQRNLDWYRFWLQGYERPNPDDPDQYKRWEHLRELQDAEDKPAGIASPTKPQ
jgi:dipeptidyl aminopeptidase/acylaminoacyl peptidase